MVAGIDTESWILKSYSIVFLQNNRLKNLRIGIRENIWPRDWPLITQLNMYSCEVLEWQNISSKSWQYLNTYLFKTIFEFKRHKDVVRWLHIKGKNMPHVAPGDFVLVDSFIDRTTKRSQTFHDQKSANQSSVIYFCFKFFNYDFENY